MGFKNNIQISIILDLFQVTEHYEFHQSRNKVVQHVKRKEKKQQNRHCKMEKSPFFFYGKLAQSPFLFPVKMGKPQWFSKKSKSPHSKDGEITIIFQKQWRHLLFLRQRMVIFPLTWKIMHEHFGETLGKIKDRSPSFSPKLFWQPNLKTNLFAMFSRWNISPLFPWWWKTKKMTETSLFFQRVLTLEIGKK